MSIKTLLLFMAADVATGLLLALRERNLNSSMWGKGILKKAGAIFMVLMAHPIESFATVSLGLDIELGLERAVAIAYTFTEIISIVENLAGVGVPIPAGIVGVLCKAKKMVKWADTQQIRSLKEQSGQDGADSVQKEK